MILNVHEYGTKYRRSTVHYISSPLRENVSDEERNQWWKLNEYSGRIWTWNLLLRINSNLRYKYWGFIMNHVNLEVWFKPERINELLNINVQICKWMTESVELFRAESAELVGELRCWLERLARSQTFRRRRYDDFRRACRCRGALKSWW